MQRGQDVGTREPGDAATVPSTLSPDRPGVSLSPRLSVSASSPPLLIAGVEVDNLSQQEAIEAVERLISDGGQHYMSVVNASKLVAASRDRELRRALLGADLVTADGMSVVWAARLLGRPLKERVTGIDLFERLVAHSARKGWAVYFLGARPESVRSTVERFTIVHPDLRVAGFRDGYFGESTAGAVADEVRASGAEVLFVAMGSPRQERWISENLERSAARFAMGVGGSFDHVAGLARRAPEWMRRAGLEWLYRLAREPRRMWRRYLIGNGLFIALVAKQIVCERRTDSGGEQVQ